MSSFFNMYIEYTDRNLKEYNKILNTITSCQNKTHYETIISMAEQFARNSDLRRCNLKKRSMYGILKFSLLEYKEYLRYKNSALEQIESIIQHCNDWTQQYDDWTLKQKEIDEKNQKDKKTISGFSELFKKRRSKKKGNQ